MARKVFVSYKHLDPGVRQLVDVYGLPISQTTARHYVEKLRGYLDMEDHIYKGEGNEDLSAFKDETIETKLKEKIFDSTITIVFISKNMKELHKSESDQWIPWEVSYSLREKTKNGRTSAANAALAVILPDENSSYSYFVEPTGCSTCLSVNWKTQSLFHILGQNMFNLTKPNTVQCVSGVCGPLLHTGSDHSYIFPVKWDAFIQNVNSYIDHAVAIRERMNDYKLVKMVTEPSVAKYAFS